LNSEPHICGQVLYNLSHSTSPRGPVLMLKDNKSDVMLETQPLPVCTVCQHFSASVVGFFLVPLRGGGLKIDVSRGDNLSP
jgi:hypothetical protein